MMKPIRTVCVVSDLHMFCRRSQWRDVIDMIHKAAAGVDLFVFNGDTFDFKWTMLRSVEETVEQALAFLRELATSCPHTRIHVNLGNHDHVQAFIHALDALTRETPNLTWHPYYLRVGNTMFLHGDVAQRKMRHHQLERYRAGGLHRRKQGQWKNRVYDALLEAGAHVTVSRLAFPRRRTARLLAAYLRDIGHGPHDGVEQVCFGHTHVRMSAYEYRGLTFHNGGAPFRGMDFHLIHVEV